MLFVPLLVEQNIGHSIEKGVPSEPYLVEQNICHSIEKGVPGEPFLGNVPFLVRKHTSYEENHWQSCCGLEY